MASFKTIIVDDELSVQRRLSDFGLALSQFEEIASVAKMWADDASPLMPLNAPGTLAYIYGVHELRNQLLDQSWVVDRVAGIEAVINRELGIRIAYQNVDRACDFTLKPRPRTAKGAGAESISGPTLFEYAGIEPGPVVSPKSDGISTYYVMVAEDGSVELSCPIVENGSFAGFVERIFIRRVGDDWVEAIDQDNSPVDDFDVAVSFRNDADV